MTGRISRLIDDQEFGTIAGEDGTDYVFSSQSLVGTAFGLLQVGVPVTFVRIGETQRAEAVRVQSKKPSGPDVERLR